MKELDGKDYEKITYKEEGEIMEEIPDHEEEIVNEFLDELKYERGFTDRRGIPHLDYLDDGYSW